MPQQRIQDPSAWYSVMARRLGISRLTDFLLADVVSPVALVDSYVTLTANTVPPLYGVPSTAGEVVPAANARLADTGVLAAGNWTITVIVTSTETNTYRLRRRDAADAADVWSQRLGAVLSGSVVFTGRFSIAASERFVLENVAASGGGTYQASIFAVQS